MNVDNMIFSVMRIVAFAVGILGFAMVLYAKPAEGQTKEVFLKLGFCTVLILVGLLGGHMTSFKAGPDGFELGFNAARKAAEEIVLANPKIAEQISGEQGDVAMSKALDKIRKTQSVAELTRIIPYEIKDQNIYFKPKTTTSAIKVPLDTIAVQPALRTRLNRLE